MLVGLKWSEDTSLKHLIKEAYFTIDYFKEYVIQHSMSMEGRDELTGDSKVVGDINWEGISFGEEKSLHLSSSSSSSSSSLNSTFFSTPFSSWKLLKLYAFSLLT